MIEETICRLLEEATADVTNSVATVRELMTNLKRGKLADALRGWWVVRNSYEALDEARKELNTLIEEMSRVNLPEIMAEEDVKTITLDDIRRRFTVNVRVGCSMPDKDIGFAWLKANGHGGLIQETVNAQTLAAFAKNMAAEKKDLPPDIFKITTMNYVSATKIGASWSPN